MNKLVLKFIKPVKYCIFIIIIYTMIKKVIKISKKFDVITFLYFRNIIFVTYTRINCTLSEDLPRGRKIFLCVVRNCKEPKTNNN